MKTFCAEKLQERWKEWTAFDPEFFYHALHLCAEKTIDNLSFLGERTASDIALGGKYIPSENNTWTAGFWPGLLWKTYLFTKNEAVLQIAKKHTVSLKDRLDRKIHIKNHDLGFIASLSAGADFVVTEDMRAKEIMIDAAYRLCDMYRFKAGIIQRDGDLSDFTHRFCGVFIVDCMNNVPLLFSAANLTGDRVLYEIAYRHMKNSVDTLVQKNGQICQSGVADVATGERRPDFTLSQGKGGKDAAWGRGQAWAVCGLPISYFYTGDEEFLTAAKAAACYFLNRMPTDFVSAWDLYYTEDNVQKDSSASAIAACGLLRLSAVLPEDDADKKIFYNAAVKILTSLVKNYFIKDSDNMGLLSSGTYGFTMNKGIDVPIIFGDYYFMEGLMQILECDTDFWAINED